MAKLKDLAYVLRSKNSGPFAVTLDVLFQDYETYRRVRDSGRLSPETIAEIYHIPLDSVTDCACFDAAMGIKITYLRPISSGTAGDRDVYGAQQHAPLMELSIPWEEQDQ